MAILAGQRIRALDFAGNAYIDDATDAGSITATAFAVTTPVVGVAFMAPTSGAVEIVVYCRGKSGTNASNRLLASVIVNTGGVVNSGANVFTPGDDQAVEFGGTPAGIQGGASMNLVVSGLTPGSLYNATYAAHVNSSVAGSAGTIVGRRISVKPWLG